MSRLIVLQQVYHHGPSTDRPVIMETRSAFRTIDEAPYVRPVPANHEWHQVDYGWLKAVSEVVIKPRGLATVELSFRGDGHVDAIVMPGTDARFTPAGALFARGGEYGVYAYPELTRVQRS